MQAVAPEQQESSADTTGTSYPFVIRVEYVAYAVLIAVAVLLRLAELDSVPLSDVETRQALAAWRVTSPIVAGEAIVANSPIQFWGQVGTFTLMGSTEFAARIFTALGGVLLTLTPLVFRSKIGLPRAFFFSLFLMCSPVVLIASRFGAGAVWSVTFAMLGLWMVWRYYEFQQPRDARWATGFFGVMVFLSDPGGPVLAVILLVAGGLTLFRTMLRAPEQLDMPGDDVLQHAKNRLLTTWPWQQSLVIVGGLVIIVSTGFLFYTPGLSMVAELLGDSLSGITHTRDGAPPFFGLYSAVFYEPFLWVFAVIGVWLLRRRQQMTIIERFLMMWVVTAVFISIVYLGTQPEYALWLVMPLAGLAAYTVVAALENHRESLLFWIDEDITTYWRRVARTRLILAAATIILLIVIAIHVQKIGRGLLLIPLESSPGDVFNLMMQSGYVDLRFGIIWTVLTIVFGIVGFFLAASVWGNVVSLQGFGLGALVFVLATGVGSGWNASVTHAGNPTELWHVRATNPDLLIFRQTIGEITQRSSRGFPELPITVLVDGEVITSDGLIAWELRAYENVRFVTTVEEARREQVVIMAERDSIPNLDSSYVGQPFRISQTTPNQPMSAMDVLAWWLQRRTRDVPLQAQVVILWVRQDIFDGLPASGQR